MVPSETSCAKCRHQMEAGFLLDRGGPTVCEWVEGRPEYGWLGLRWFRKRRMPVTYFRCTACGYLEAYASPSEKH